MSCNNVSLTIQKGETWEYSLMWAALPYVYKLITGVPQLAPLRLTVTGHGFVNDQRVAISDVVGMTQLNAEGDPPRTDEYHAVTVIDSNTIEFNDIVALSYDSYVSGGVVRSLTPVNIASFSGRMDVREKVGGTLIFSVTTASTMTINNTTKKITVTVSDTITSAITQRSGVFSIEVESGTGVVTQLVSGTVEFLEEVTTTST